MNDDEISKEIIKNDGLIFSLNNEEKTAEVIGNQQQKTYFIPKSITYQGQEFNVISIKENSFKNQFIQSFDFSKDSLVRKIEKNAFQYSHIENLAIPASVIDLEECWDARMYRLSNVTVSSNNQRYKKQDDFIIGKSDEKSDNFDVLIFVTRQIKTITIPPNIRRISSYLFSCSSIEYIVFPPSVTVIGEFAFFNCIQLHHIEFPADSKLQTIEPNAFYLSSIKSLALPASLSELKKGWCCSTKQLIKVTIGKNNRRFKNDENDEKMIIGKSDNFDVLVFVSRDAKLITIPPSIKLISAYSFSYSSIESVVIPPSVTVIEEDAFYNCIKLINVDIPPDSQLRTICKEAFHCTSINKIYIPRHVTKICEMSFSNCYNLEQIEFPADSNLSTIEYSAFSATKIKSIEIPARVSELKDGWCQNTAKLTKVKINSENKFYKECENDNKIILGKSDKQNDNFDVLAFASRDIKRTIIPLNIRQISCNSFCLSTIRTIIIPPSVTHICKNAFTLCRLLRRVEIQKNSQLVEIGQNSFYFTLISEFYVPEKITKISQDTFNLCKKLKFVEFPINSQIKVIEEDAFAHSGISSFIIPPLVTKIKENAFYECINLKIIEIDEQSNIKKDDFIDIYCNFIMIPKRLEKNFI